MTGDTQAGWQLAEDSATAYERYLVPAIFVEMAERPRRERHVPRWFALGLALHALAPRPVERLLRRALARWHFGGEKEPETKGNLYEPSGDQARIQGSRPPRLRAPALAAWAALEVMRMQVDSARRRLARRGAA